MGKALDLSGKKFGKLVALHVDHDNKERHRKWICKCECGNIVSVSTDNLTSGNTKSCGCTRKKMLTERNTSHGLSKTPDYRFWTSFIKKIKLSNLDFDERWNSFESFLDDMGSRPNGESIGRLDISKKYSKDNCRWMNPKDIEVVRKTSTLISYNGETHTFSGWAKKYNISSSLISSRYKKGILPPELFKRNKIVPSGKNTNRKHHGQAGRPRNKTIFAYNAADNYFIANIEGHEIKVSPCDYDIVKNFHWIINKSGYVETHFTENGKYRRLFMHRLVLGLKDTSWKDMIVDHINEDKLDNRRENLRFSDFSTNQINRRYTRKDNTSGHVGVYKERNKWRVNIHGKYFGSFYSYEEATKYREKLEKDIYEEFAPDRPNNMA